MSNSRTEQLLTSLRLCVENHRGTSLERVFKSPFRLPSSKLLEKACQVTRKTICFLNPWNPVFLHSRSWLDFSKTFWTHHLSDSKTKTVIDFFVAMHLRMVCDNFCKSMVMMEVLVVGENSWVRMEFFFTESSSLSVITQTVVTCHSCSIHASESFSQRWISWGYRN